MSKLCDLCEIIYDYYIILSNGNHTNEECPHQNKVLKNHEQFKLFGLCRRTMIITYEWQNKTIDMKSFISKDLLFKIKQKSLKYTASNIKFLFDDRYQIFDIMARYDIFKTLRYRTLPKFFNIHNFDFQKTIVTNWYFINMYLTSIGKIKHTYIAEDKRSGLNLLKYIEIDGVKVNHNAKRDCITSTDKGEYFHEILALFIRILAQRNAFLSAKTLLQIRYFKKSIISTVPKDIIKMISKMVIESKHDICWTMIFNEKYIECFENLKNDWQCIKFEYE